MIADLEPAIGQFRSGKALKPSAVNEVQGKFGYDIVTKAVAETSGSLRVNHRYFIAGK
jgi:hypothetical protein